MFDEKVIKAYKQIKPSDELRDKVLNRQARAPAPKILMIKRIGSIAACLLLVVSLSGVIGRMYGNDSPLTVALSDGTVLGHEATAIETTVASYTGAARIAFYAPETELPTFPAPSSTDNCFYFELSSKSTEMITVNFGSVFIFDTEADNYVDCGTSAFFEGTCQLYWHLPDTTDQTSYRMTVQSEKGSSCIELTKQDSGFTAALIPSQANGN